MVYCKRLFVLLFIFVLLFNTISYGVEDVKPTYTYNGYAVQTDNQYYTLYIKEYQIQTNICMRLLRDVDNSYNKQFVTRFVHMIRDLGIDNKFLYFTEAPATDVAFDCYVGYKDNFSVSVYDYVSIGDYYYTNCPIITGNLYRFARFLAGSIEIPTSSVQVNNVSFPYAMSTVFCSDWIEVFKAYGVYYSVFEQELLDKLEDLATNTSANYNTALNNINNSINNQGNAINSSINNQTSTLHSDNQNIKNEISETNDFLKNDSVSDSSMNLPSDSSNDITKDGINNIFTMIYDAFTSGDYVSINLPIPFTNKSIVIDPNFLYNILHGNQTFRVIYELIQGFYWYAISVFIISDVSKKITKIKGGNLENIANSNIKEEML